MSKWFVIADNLTGAAEVAGIAHHFGYSVKFITYGSGDRNAREDVVVFNADTRNVAPENAAGKIRHILLHGGFRDDRR